MKRLYQSLVQWHFTHYDQMVFLAGPRQVGKTTVGEALKALYTHYCYLNWDIDSDRALILKGQGVVAHHAGLDQLRASQPLIIFDEIHKYPDWKNFLKGFFDRYHQDVHIVVTGSSRLDVFRAGGDSLMGRYFVYRMHPMSIAECLRSTMPVQVIAAPQSVDKTVFDTLVAFGGFPAPFLKKNLQFSNVWKRLRKEQLFREDIRDLTHIQEIARLEILADLIRNQAGNLLSLHALSQKVGVAVNTLKRWMQTLESFYYCFLIRPYAQNVVRSLTKEPKVYLWDWSDVLDQGAKYENFVASHLLKAVHAWTDLGFGNYELCFVRDKEKREVDFLIIQDGKPWCLIEVKSSKNMSISEHLYRFQSQLKVPYAFQLVFDAAEIIQDCFKPQKEGEVQAPLIVPVQTFLSQLL